MDTSYIDMRTAVETLMDQGALSERPDLYRSSFDMVCPVCGEPNKPFKKKLRVSLDPVASGLVPPGGSFVCSKCRISGGPMAFYALFHGFSNNKDAAKHYHDYMQGKDVKEGETRKVYTPPPRVDLDIAGIEVRDYTYSSLLDILPLTDKHRNHLIEKRGLSEETIMANGYRSVPLTNFTEIATALLKKGCILKGVPGFYESEDGPSLKRFKKSGILIPLRDGRGRIQAFQIRYDNVGENEQRYIYLSTTGMKDGSSSGSPAHFRMGKRGLEDVLITEGPLKGDIISHKTGYSLLTIQGVGAQRPLGNALYELKQKGLNKVGICFDMDLYTNASVLESLEKLKSMLEALEIPYYQIVWDAKEESIDGEVHLELKGLDDFLLAQ